MKPAANYEDAIHNSSYDELYLSRLITHESMIFDRGRAKESLNGLWNFSVDPYDTCLRAKWFEEKDRDDTGRPLPVDYAFDLWERMPVPSCWNMRSERYFLYEGSAVYTRTFRYVRRGERRVFLKFGAVNYDAKVFLNRQYLGCHLGGSTPFYVEVTDLLQENNRLLVVANNTRRRHHVPCENTDWFNYGGIYRDVELIRLPETFIRDMFIRLVPDGCFDKIAVDLETDGPDADGEALVLIPELGVRRPVEVRAGRGSAVIEARPELWSPDRPKLYEVRVYYRDDAIRETIGFREIRVDGRDILLNGRPIFLKGVCAHEESVTGGKTLTEAEIIENFRIAKEMNCNFMRLAHYPHSERAAQLADEIGLLLWEEIPVYWAIDFGNERTYRDAENQLTELIKRDRNRASVVVWSVGNENADTDARLSFMSRLARKAKELDPTRLVSAACMLDHERHLIADRLVGELDIIGVNEYYGWYRPDFENLVQLFENSQPDKPVVITEFGADAKAGHRGTADDLGTEDCQLDVYRRQVGVLSRIPYVKGTSPWILYDFRCPRRLHPVTQNFYNTKGLLSADKTYRKPAFYVMQRFYAEREERAAGGKGSASALE
ncbi:MAG: glycosyl hydrolase family 2 [Candidatus Reconcilbacillus cellulovorans]|uniref:Glycosyl hydrolase family 2 n=1 Tax=Candidatus Reconcilbacillus cellulovorans TaxID=1906605 RepID=A0A2A6DWC6_9BACL|nr:MAG: glycosyl hydrolase family 2 [Candidatus Reconcilbacillus cellulovorans]